MKVISIKEPFATLIMNGTKKIETRSWKTNYRGELFIHASGKSLTKEFPINNTVLNLIQGLDMNYGNIICKGTLVNCIYMDEKFISEIKKDSIEYECGLYEVGRYAWVFENVAPIYPIPVKGKLNIWNFDGKYEVIKKQKHS